MPPNTATSPPLLRKPVSSFGSLHNIISESSGGGWWRWQIWQRQRPARQPDQPQLVEILGHKILSGGGARGNGPQEVKQLSAFFVLDKIPEVAEQGGAIAGQGQQRHSRGGGSQQRSCQQFQQYGWDVLLQVEIPEQGEGQDVGRQEQEGAAWQQIVDVLVLFQSARAKKNAIIPEDCVNNGFSNRILRNIGGLDLDQLFGANNFPNLIDIGMSKSSSQVNNRPNPSSVAPNKLDNHANRLSTFLLSLTREDAPSIISAKSVLSGGTPLNAVNHGNKLGVQLCVHGPTEWQHQQQEHQREQPPARRRQAKCQPPPQDKGCQGRGVAHRGIKCRGVALLDSVVGLPQIAQQSHLGHQKGKGPEVAQLPYRRHQYPV